MIQQSEFVGEAINLVQKAQEKGLSIRVLGAVAFRIHCPEHVHVHIQMGREITDIDFAAYSKDENREIR
jgi:hypothetical protein